MKTVFILSLPILAAVLILNKPEPGVASQGAEVSKVDNLLAAPRELIDPELRCEQKKGEDRPYPNNPAVQVECDTVVAGRFYWARQLESGEWRAMYMNAYPLKKTGFLFQADPGLLRVTFIGFGVAKDASVEFRIVTDYRPCVESIGCLRVLWRLLL